MVNIIWISLDPVTKEFIPFPKYNATMIEKKFVEYQICSEEEKLFEKNNSIFLGSNCFNATVRFIPINNTQKYICKQTTPGIQGGPRGSGKSPGERSVMRIEVPENNKITIGLKNITERYHANLRWRFSNDDSLGEKLEYQIPEEYIISGNNLTSLSLEVWKSTDLDNLDEGFLKTERVVWQWCKGVQEDQGNLFSLSDSWWLPYGCFDNNAIEEGLSNNCKEISIIPSDKIPRRISLEENNSFGKQIRFENGRTVGFRVVRRKIMTIKQLQNLFNRMKDTPVDINSLINSLKDDEIPIDFCCPISQTLMKNPVKTSDGFTYDCVSIEKWFSYGNITSPLTNLPLVNTNLVVNVQLKDLIDEFLREKHKLSLGPSIALGSSSGAISIS